MFFFIKESFKNYNDGTHAYAVYKVLYDAATIKLIEDDYTTTDWEGCNGKQYASAGPVYCFRINAKATETNKNAAMIFVKLFTEKSIFVIQKGQYF